VCSATGAPPNLVHHRAVPAAAAAAARGVGPVCAGSQEAKEKSGNEEEVRHRLKKSPMLNFFYKI